jgi:hypothetical protein
MSDPNPPVPPAAPPLPASSAPPGGQEPREWRVPDTDPRVWARGKNASELLSLTDQAIGYAQAASQQYQPPPPPPTQSFDPRDVRDEDFIDGKTLKNILATASQPYQQGFEQVWGNIASNNVSQIRSQKREAFERYGHEIQPLIDKLPLPARTLDNLALTVDLVMGRHLQEERKRWEDESRGDPTLRGGSAPSLLGGSSPSSGPLTKSDELPADYRAMLERKGIDDRKLEEFFVTMNMGPEDRKKWFETAKKHNMNVITERSSRGF